MARLRDAARMFAAVDMSVADAGISVWYAKYCYGYWRPSTAINLADTDGNPAYPEYPSGYNEVAGDPLPLRQHRGQGHGRRARRLDPRPLLPAPPRPRPGGIVLAA
jgi:hypothetical protein